jgi:2-polyprenyl-3-methyl-5-hydroxy-6-metoxy-1,4-benzoquinol methylase
MFNGMKHRALEPELMDDLSAGGRELREALGKLRLLNRIFAAAPPTLYGVKRLWRAADKPRHLTVLDIGAGSGDVNRKLLRWANANRIDLKITLMDRAQEACEEAKLYFQNEPRVQVVRQDVYALPEACVDIVTGTQFVHHFTTEELPGVVASMLKAARIGVVVNDIHRHFIPWAAVWLTTRLISGNRYIQHDGPLSVAKGFRAADWIHLKKALGQPGMFYAWRPLFRYIVVIRKSQPINRATINT